MYLSLVMPIIITRHAVNKLYPLGTTRHKPQGKVLRKRTNTALSQHQHYLAIKLLIVYFISFHILYWHVYCKPKDWGISL